MHYYSELFIFVHAKCCVFFLENKAVGVMKPGHTFTIEPMISQGTHSLFCSQDIDG